MRTPEQIIADCEAAYERLREKAKSPDIIYPCTSCRYYEGYSISYAKCHHPLVKGYGSAPDFYRFARSGPSPCGPEKALWEPRRNWLQRLIDWLLEPFFTPQGDE